MFCTECGNEVEDTCRTCPYCGNVLLESEENHSDTGSTEELTQERNGKDSYKTMRNVLRIMSIIAFACFFCPLYMFSFLGQEIFSASGLDMMIGFEWMGEQLDGHIVYGLLGLVLCLGIYVTFVNRIQSVKIFNMSEMKENEIFYGIFEQGTIIVTVNIFFNVMMLNVLEDTIYNFGTCIAWNIMILCGVGMMILGGYCAYRLEGEKRKFAVQCLVDILDNSIVSLIIVSIIYFVAIR